MTRTIFCITDFGLADSYVGQVKAIIAGIAPDGRIVDITHDVAPFAIEEGAWLWESVLPVLPLDAVVLAVVDPGVGSERREIAVRSGERLFVGPDNGLLSPAYGERQRELAPYPGGGETTVEGVEVRELCAPQFRRAHVSATFHGRDIFAPAAAHLARGQDIRMMGPPVANVTAFPSFRGFPGKFGELHGHVVHVDRYGNLVTTVRSSQLFPTFEIEVNGRTVDCRVRTFSDAPPGVCFCHADSSGFLAIAQNQASAADELGATRGTPVVVRCP